MLKNVNGKTGRKIDMVDTLTGFYNAVVFELYSEHNMILNKQWSVWSKRSKLTDIIANKNGHISFCISTISDLYLIKLKLLT